MKDSDDIYYDTERKDLTDQILFRVPKRYSDFIRKRKIKPMKLFMRACEDLDKSLLKEENEE